MPEITPNAFAYVMLLGWPVWALFAFRRFRPPIAAMLVLTGGALFLPCIVGFDLPLVPMLDKDTIPPLSALLAASLFARERVRNTRPFMGLELLVPLQSLGCVGTALSNGQPVIHGSLVLQGLTLHDAVAGSLAFLLNYWAPFYVGRAMFQSVRDLRDLLSGLAIAGLVYSVFIIVEVRFSPQFHYWVYGYGTSPFAQGIRFGGWRPVVFTRHGLMLALFMLLALMSTTALAKAKVLAGPIKAGRAAWYLALILVLCKSAGAMVYATVAIPALGLLSTKGQMRIAVIIGALVLSYPLLRLSGLVPADDIADFFASAINEERGGSLRFRLTNEEEVLENTRDHDHLLFGWGGYGRGLLFDDETGKQTSVMDGLWVIEVTTYGLVGFLCMFGLVLFPVFRAHRIIPLVRSARERTLLAALSLIVVFYVIDWVPNASVSTDLTMIAGALYGLAPGILRQQRIRERKSRAKHREDDAAVEPDPFDEVATPS